MVDKAVKNGKEKNGGEVAVKIQGMEALQEKLASLLKPSTREEEILARLQEIEQKVKALKEEEKNLREELAKIRANARQNPEARAAAQAVAALKVLGIDLGIDVPDLLPKNGNGGRKTSRNGGRRLVLSVDGTSFPNDKPSDVLWYNTKGCGGSNREGRLSIEDLMRLVEQTGRKYEEGNWEVALPNGKKIAGVWVEE